MQTKTSSVEHRSSTSAGYEEYDESHSNTTSDHPPHLHHRSSSCADYHVDGFILAEQEESRAIDDVQKSAINVVPRHQALGYDPQKVETSPYYSIQGVTDSSFHHHGEDVSETSSATVATKNCSNANEEEDKEEEDEELTEDGVGGIPMATTNSTTTFMQADASKNCSVLQQKWNQMFERLKAFKQQRGNCLVPNRYPKDQPLGAWVSTQRRQYKILALGGAESTPTNIERASKLEALGFMWSTADPRHVPWELRYSELVEFRKEHGNCLVPIGYKKNVKLANWVSTQRQEYKILCERMSSRLSSEKVDLLKKINFVWEVRRGGRPRKRSLSDDDSDEGGNKVSPAPPKVVKKPKKMKRLKLKVAKKQKTRDTRAALVAGTEFVAANVGLPSAMPQQPGLLVEGSPHLQQQTYHPHQLTSLPLIHHNHQQPMCTMLQSHTSHANLPSLSGLLASSYARNAAVAAASAQQATAAPNVAVAAAANFLRQGAPPSEPTPSSLYSYTPSSYMAKTTNAAIDWHKNVYQAVVHEAVYYVANQQTEMKIMQNGAKAVPASQARDAHAKAQTAQVHALLQEQHAQVAQRSALAVQHQRQAAEALARFRAITTSMTVQQAPSRTTPSSQESTNPSSLNPLEAPPSNIVQAPPSWNHHNVAAAGLEKETAAPQLADNITSTSSTQQSSSVLPPVQSQLLIRHQIELRRRGAAAAAEIFQEANAITIIVPPTKNEVLDAAASKNKSIQRSSLLPHQPAVVAMVNDDADIFDDADEDSDFTAQPLKK